MCASGSLGPGARVQSAVMWTLVSSVLDFHFIYVTVFIYLFTFSGASASDQRAIYAIFRGKCTLDRVVHPRARAVCTVGDQVVCILPRRGVSDLWVSRAMSFKIDSQRATSLVFRAIH